MWFSNCVLLRFDDYWFVGKMLRYTLTLFELKLSILSNLFKRFIIRIFRNLIFLLIKKSSIIFWLFIKKRFFTFNSTGKKRNFHFINMMNRYNFTPRNTLWITLYRDCFCIMCNFVIIRSCLFIFPAAV